MRSAVPHAGYQIGVEKPAAFAQSGAMNHWRILTLLLGLRAMRWLRGRLQQSGGAGGGTGKSEPAQPRRNRNCKL